MLRTQVCAIRNIRGVPPCFRTGQSCTQSSGLHGHTASNPKLHCHLLLPSRGPTPAPGLCCSWSDPRGPVLSCLLLCCPDPQTRLSVCHTHMLTCAYTYAHVCIQAHTRACTDAYVTINMHTFTHLNTHLCAHRYTCARTKLCTSRHSCTLTHTYKAHIHPLVHTSVATRDTCTRCSGKHPAHPYTHLCTRRCTDTVTRELSPGSRVGPAPSHVVCISSASKPRDRLWRWPFWEHLSSTLPQGPIWQRK